MHCASVSQLVSISILLLALIYPPPRIIDHLERQISRGAITQLRRKRHRIERVIISLCSTVPVTLEVLKIDPVTKFLQP